MGQFVWGEGFRECPSQSIIFTPNAQIISKLRGEGEGKNRKLIVCAIRVGACERSLHASADLMIDYEEKVNGATISMREGLTK